MSYHQNNYYPSANPTPPSYGNAYYQQPPQPPQMQVPPNNTYATTAPVTPGMNYSPGSSPAMTTPPGYTGYPVPTAQSLASRQVSTKAKIEKFIIRKSENSVIVRDLSFFCTEEHLQTLVSCYGECLKVHLCRSEEANHRSLLHAFVEMGSEESILTLIEELDGVLFMGRQLKIQRCIGQLKVEDMIAMKQMKQGIQVHVRFESVEDRSHCIVTEQRLRDIFSDCGTIEDAIVQRHSQNLWKQKGYGFLFFEDMESAERAVQTKNGIMFDNVYYSAAFTHKTKEKLQEIASGMSTSVDYSMSASYDHFQPRVSNSFSMSRDEHYHSASTGYGTYSSDPIPGATGYYASAASASSPNDQHHRSIQPSPNAPSTLSYSRSQDYNLSGPGIDLGSYKSQQPSPALSTYGATTRVSSYNEDDNTTTYNTSTESTPQNGYYHQQQRRGTGSSFNSTDGHTTGNPSPTGPPHPFNRAFSVEGENSYHAGIAAGKDAANVPILNSLTTSPPIGSLATEGIAVYSTRTVDLDRM